MISSTPGYYCVCACASAEEAVIEIPALEPHVVLLDIDLSGESGVASTSCLRKKMPDLPIIMLTVYRNTKMIFLAIKAGACGYVLKRSDDKEILESIAEVRAGGAPMVGEIARMVMRFFSVEPEMPDADVTDRPSALELEILALLADGCPKKEIASRLSISIATVRTHLMQVYKKVHARCNTEVE
jgi:DNA-binding NarL/FixJ family response regulator